jgi:hypothetical protein
MLAEAPLPLLPQDLLLPLIGLVRPFSSPPVGSQLGVWLRNVTGSIPVCVSAQGGSCRVLLSGDLGLLLKRCNYVAVRVAHEARVLPADALIQWRALQVVTSTPCLPSADCLKKIFPHAVFDAGGFRIPLRGVVPEAVLAACVMHSIGVTETRIVYAAPPPGGSSV